MGSIPARGAKLGDDMNVVTGSVWKSSDYSDFIVEAVRLLAGETWVHYAKTDKFGFATEQKYNCLEGAFKLRFHPVVQ